MIYIERNLPKAASANGHSEYKNMFSYVHDEGVGSYADVANTGIKKLPVDKKKIVNLLNRFGISVATNVSDNDLKNLVNDNVQKVPAFKEALDGLIKSNSEFEEKTKEFFHGQDANTIGSQTKSKELFTTTNVLIGLAIAGLAYWAWKSGIFKSK